MRLEQWCLRVRTRDRFKAPELRPAPSLSGLVFGHPLRADGEKVTTSAIVRAEGHRVETASGHVYELGEADPAYLAHMSTIGVDIDPEDPLARTRAPNPES